MTHTPGPWHDDGYRIYAPTDHPDKRNGRIIVEYKHLGDFNRDDARLIAAAPELLAACKLAAEIADSWIHDQLDGTGTVHKALAELNPVWEAIAKAEGQPCNSR
jgi:hypothetical protein